MVLTNKDEKKIVIIKRWNTKLYENNRIKSKLSNLGTNFLIIVQLFIVFILNSIPGLALEFNPVPSNATVEHPPYFNSIHFNEYLTKNYNQKHYRVLQRPPRDTKFDWQKDEAIDNEHKNRSVNSTSSIVSVSYSVHSVQPSNNIMKIKSHDSAHKTHGNHQPDEEKNTGKILSPASITLSAGEYFYDLDKLKNAEIMKPATTEVNKPIENKPEIDKDLIEYLKKHSQQNMEMGKPLESDVKSILWNGGNDSNDGKVNHTVNVVVKVSHSNSSNKENKEVKADESNKSNHNSKEEHSAKEHSHDAENKTSNSNEHATTTTAKIDTKIDSNNATKLDSKIKTDNETDDENEYRVESRWDYIHEQMKQIMNSAVSHLKDKVTPEATTPKIVNETNVSDKLDTTTVAPIADNLSESTMKSDEISVNINNQTHRIAVDEEEIFAGENDHDKDKKDNTSIEPSTSDKKPHTNHTALNETDYNGSIDINIPAHRIAVDEEEYIKPTKIDEHEKPTASDSTDEKTSPVSIHITSKPKDNNKTIENHNVTKRNDNVDRKIKDINDLPHRIAVDEEEYIHPKMDAKRSSSTHGTDDDSVLKLPLKSDMEKKMNKTENKSTIENLNETFKQLENITTTSTTVTSETKMTGHKIDGN